MIQYGNKTTPVNHEKYLRINIPGYIRVKYPPLKTERIYKHTKINYDNRIEFSCT